MKRLLFCLFASYVLVYLCLPSASAQQQVAWCSPKEVRWGDTLTVYYNTKATKATLSVRDEVYANFYFTMTDGSFKETSIKLTLADKMFIGKYVIEDSLSEGHLAIHTPEKWVRVGDDFIALRKDGIPARGATVSKIWSDSTAFSKEIALYPDNFAAYPAKWEYLQYAKKFDESKLKQVILNDLTALTRNNTANPGRYSALASAYKQLGKMSDYYDMLRRLGKEFPLSPYTGQQLIRFSLQQYNDSTKWEIRALIRSIASRFPTSSIAREMVKHSFADTTLTISTTKNIFDAWIAQESNNLEAYMEFLRLAKRTKPVPENTALFAQYALELMMKPEVRVRYQMNNNYSIGDLYRQVSDALIAAGRTGQALVVLKAAHTFEFDADTQSELVAKEGSLLLQSGQVLLAQEAFVKSYTLGSKTAKDSALLVYKQIRGTDSGFAAFLKQKSDSIAALNKKPAPTFMAKGLDGKTYDIAKLKGKAIVLNFWFIGCPPCRQEIPSLNTLAKEFAKKDVVFLALALDDEKDLKEFLKKTPFTYTIVPKASEVSQKYGVEAFPTHIVIDRNGMNIGQLVGGSETRHEDLRPLIERALE
ncbi:MAG: TlpA family protein disulfide reductase [Ignavibacteria bacterium]|nr:TlpA family protein disulfide reductase [Ignavibacteria bacterium]